MADFGNADLFAAFDVDGGPSEPKKKKFDEDLETESPVAGPNISFGVVPLQDEVCSGQL